MRKVFGWFSAVPLACLFMVGCGGSGHHTPPANQVPVVLTLQDQPPAGLTALSFVVQVSGVSLQPADSSQQSVALLTTPVTVNLSNLQTLNALLANTSAPAGTYNSITITFSTPQVTVINNTGAQLGDGTNTCAPSATAACALSPSLSANSVVVSTAPFPLMLTAGTPIQIGIDFNSADSLAISDGTLGITPVVTVTTNTTTNATTGNLVDFVSGTGQVTAASNNQVTVTDISTGQPLTLSTTANTVFTNFNMSATCTAINTFACVQAGQNVNFNFGVSGAAGSGPTLTSLNLNNGVTNGVTGTVISTNPFEVLVTSASPAFVGGDTGLTVGQVVQVSPSTGAVFSAQTNGSTLPAGLMFAGSNDLGIGQSVMLDSTGFTAGTGTKPGSLTTDNVMLVPSQFGGNINSLDATNQSFELNGLNGLFTGNNISDVNVNTSTGTTFTGGTTNDFTGLAVRNTVNTGGLLFNSPTEGGQQVLVGGQVGVTGTTATALRSQ